MKKLPNDILLKCELVSRYIWPAWGLQLAPDDPLTKAFAACCHRVAVSRYQVLKKPGGWEDGYLYWFEWALAHSYYYDHDNRQTGLCIFPCDEPVANAESILYREERYTYLQALENGVALRISYPCVRAVMKGYPLLEGAIRQLAERQDDRQREQAAFGSAPVPERIETFIDRHFSLLTRLSLDVQLMHMQTNDQTFRAYMRRSRSGYASIRPHRRAQNPRTT